MKIADILSRSELFSELPSETLDEIANICHSREISKGEFVFQIGDPSNDLFILAEGALDIGFGIMSAEQSDGGMIKEPGEVFGWSALVGETNFRMINAIGVQQTRLIVLNGTELMNLLEGHPRAGFAFLRKLLAVILNRIVSVAAT